MTYQFTIPGRIKPKQRPRRARSGIFYTPRPTLLSEEIVAKSAISAQMKPIPEGDVSVDMAFFGSYGNCDLDNLIKTVLDGLKDFFNDRQVVAIRATKTKSKEHWTEVEISENIA